VDDVDEGASGRHTGKLTWARQGRDDQVCRLGTTRASGAHRSRVEGWACVRRLEAVRAPCGGCLGCCM
jgi:hypothetical protein